MSGLGEFAKFYSGETGAKNLREEFKKEKDRWPFILMLADRFMNTAREAILTERDGKSGSTFLERGETVFNKYPEEAGGILLGALVFEIYSSIEDKKFSLKTVINRFNNMLVGTKLPALKLEGEENEEEYIPEDVAISINKDVQNDKTFTNALSTIYKLPNLHKFLDRNKAFQPLHLSKQIWSPLASEVMNVKSDTSRDFPNEEFTGSPDRIELLGSGVLLEEGKYNYLPDGDEERRKEMENRGFTPSQIAALNHLRDTRFI